MIRSRRLNLCLSLLCAGILATLLDTPARPDDSVVLVAFLNEIADQSRDARTILVETESLDEGSSIADLKSWQEIQQFIPEMSRSAAIDLLSQSRHRKPVVIPVGSLPRKMRILQPPVKDLQSVFETDERPEIQWSQLRKRLEGATAIVRFSGVGYSTNFEQAAFLMRVSCGGLCGSGNMVLMQRTVTGWRVVKDATRWVN